MLPFHAWLTRQRWYAGRHRALETLIPASIANLRADLDHVLLDASYADGGAERYQVLIAWSDDPPLGTRTDGYIGEADGRYAYDGLHDAAAARALLRMVGRNATFPGIRMRTEPGADPLPVAETATVMKAEQSNTSVVFDESAVLKVFRRVPVGVNTDLELHRLLNRAGCREVPELLGWIEGAGESTFAMLTRFAAGAVQGWESATAYAASGGDFSEQAFRLGESVAEVHATLAIELGTMPLPPPGRVMNNRLNDALAYVPALRDFVPALRAAYARADDNAHAALAQRVHGDLHLGQVLRTPDSWLLLDFEGEPGRPSAERRKLDSPLRDVAGMIRSFSYAAHYPLLAELPYGQVVDDAARDWAARHAAAFCDGYAAAGGTDPREHAALLLAYVLDKAVYEAAYEANHRPRWLPVALTSLSGLLDLVGPH